MVNPVLLSRHLNEERLSQAREEIRALEPKSEFSLVIDSEGGDMKPALDFVDFLWNIRGLYLGGVKIYNAESAAAFIALAAGTYTEMRKGAILSIHRGSVILEAADFDFESGKVVNRETIERFKKHERYLKQILESEDLKLTSDKKAMAKLHGSGWLRLTAEECLERRIVKRLF